MQYPYRFKYYNGLLDQGGVVLGYEVYDQELMVTAVQNAYKYVSTPDDKEGLRLAEEFLQGLWAEGYFD